MIVSERKRIVAIGGTVIDEVNASFCMKLGHYLIEAGDFIIVTGGFKNYSYHTASPSSDWSVVKGAINCIDKSKMNSLEYIETILPGADRDRINRFQEGNIVTHNRNMRSRRFYTINSADAIISIQGSGGTDEQIDLALALDKILLPVPCTNGASKQRWHENFKTIKNKLNLRKEEVRILEKSNLNCSGEEDRLVKTICNIFKREVSSNYDVFISYAREDEAFVEPLALNIKRAGIRVWFDGMVLEVGDSLRETIDAGLAMSKYGLVVLSENFFNKHWTKYELNSLVAKESAGSKVILPIWLDINETEVLKYSPMLADKLAFKVPPLTVEDITDRIFGMLTKR